MMPAVTDQADAIQRIKVIFRRDLKLPSDAVLADDMPLMGSEYDLDSLDLLMLLTSVEKEFGVKVASEATPRDAFKTLASLAAFVVQRGGAGAAVADAAPASPLDPIERLPHRPPFLFLTRVQSLREGHAGDATWQVTGAEPFFAGHFPGNPVVPGVLITEALAQLAGLVAPSPVAGPGSGKLAQIELRFEASAVPPAEIQLHAALVRSVPPLHQFEVRASCAGQVVARGSLTLQVAGA